MKVHLWDEIGGEWSEVEIHAGDDGADPMDNLAVHNAVNAAIDNEPDPADLIPFRVQAPGGNFNIVRMEHNMLAIELWGPDAQAVRTKLEGWYPYGEKRACNTLIHYLT